LSVATGAVEELATYDYDSFAREVFASDRGVYFAVDALGYNGPTYILKITP
jgi:hypothetical protein